MALVLLASVRLSEKLYSLQVVDSLLPIRRLVVCQRLRDARDLRIKLFIVLDILEDILGADDF